MILSEPELIWIEKIKKKRGAIAVAHPNWKGILSSSKQLFDEHYFIEDNLTNEQIEHHAEVLLASGCNMIILQGFPNSFEYLVEYVYSKKNTFPIFLIYHGNFMHTGEDYSWQAFKTIFRLCKEKKIKRLGLVKKGMDEILQSQGIDAHFIMNYYRHQPIKDNNLPISNDEIGIGIWTNWGSWQKAPFSMIAATSIIPKAKIYGSGFSQRAVELCLLLNIDYEVVFTSLPHEVVLQKMSKMHLNLYVTFSECAPMLPLESFSVGVPCLIGPNNHFFMDHEYLHSRLVVRYPDKASVIASMAMQALDERDKILKKYYDYIKEYNQQAINSVNKFISIE